MPDICQKNLLVKGILIKVLNIYWYLNIPQLILIQLNKAIWATFIFIHDNQ